MHDTSSKATSCIPSRSHLAALCDRANDALFLLDTRHHCIFMNRAAEMLIGYTLDEISGRPLRDVIGQSTGGPLPDGFPIASGQPERCTLVDRTGQIHPIVYTASPTGEDGGGTVLAMHRTGGELPAIAALKEETRILEILNRTGSMLASKLDLEEIVQAVTEAATELSGAQFGAFFYSVVRDGQALQLYTLSGASRDAFAAFPQPRHTAVFGPTFSEARVVRSPDIRRDPRYGPMLPSGACRRAICPSRAISRCPSWPATGLSTGP